MIRNQETGLEKGSPMVQKKVEKPEDSGTLKSLMSRGVEKSENIRKLLKGAGNKNQE